MYESVCHNEMLLRFCEIAKPGTFDKLGKNTAFIGQVVIKINKDKQSNDWNQNVQLLCIFTNFMFMIL